MTRQGLFQNIALGAAVLAAATAVAVLAGWHTASPALVGLGFSPIAMHYNNALAALFCATSLIAYIRQHRRAARLLAIPVLLIGTAHLLQFFLKARWDPDFWFHQWIPEPDFITTLNLAPTAALALYLLGAALLSQSHRRDVAIEREKLLRDVSLSVLAIACVSIWAIADQSADYGWGNLARMAPNSILVLTLLAIAALAIPLMREPAANSSGSAQTLVRLLVPVVIAASAILWAQLGSSEANHIRETIRQQTAMTKSGLEHSLQSQAYSLRRMANRLRQQESPDLGSWRADARLYLHDLPGLVAIGFHEGPNTVPEWIVKDNAPAYFLSETFNSALLESVQAEKRLAISIPSALKDGSSQFVLVTPASEADDSPSVIAIFDGASLTKGVIPGELIRELNMVVALDGAKLFETSAERDIFYRFWAINDEVQILDKRWRFTIWPTPAYYRAIGTNLQDIVLIAGILIAGLLMYSSQLLERAARSARHLAESQHRLSLLLDNAGEGIFGLDLQGRTTFLNKAAERITGFTAADILHKKQHDILHHSYADGSHYPEKDSKIYRVLHEGGTVFERNAVFWRADGSSYPVEYTSAAITDEQGKVYGAVVVFRDTSELVNIENRLKTTNRELEIFAHMLSHDLRAPLNQIQIFAELVEESLSDNNYEELRNYIGFMSRAAHNASSLVSELTDYLGSGQTVPLRETVDLNTLLNEVAQVLKTEIANATIDIGELPSVRSNGHLLRQIFQNLIGNGLKYNRSDKPTVQVSARSDDHQIHILVQDNGIGMNEADLANIFKPFVRLHGGSEFSGTGLGLAICQKNAERLGASLRVESRPDSGSLFTLTLSRDDVY